MTRSYFDQPDLESAEEREIVEKAERRGWFCAKFTSPGTRHVQDRIFIRRGVVIFGEIKRVGEDERPAQRVRRQQMELHGAICRVWHTWDEARHDLY